MLRRLYAVPSRGLANRGRKIVSGLRIVAKADLLDPPPPPVTRDDSTGWTTAARRVGLVAVKDRMMTDWDEWGTQLPLTVLKVRDCQVVQVKRPKQVDGEGEGEGGAEGESGSVGVQVGALKKRLARTSMPMRGHFARHGNVMSKRLLHEFQVSPPDAAPEPGTLLFAKHFVVGQYIDASGVSRGKGFQGPMKRHNFGGNRASHGASLSHRSHGSTGQSQDPGRVFKGKKMAGRMGGKQATVKNLLVYRIVPELNEIIVRGSVPGAPGTVLVLRDASHQPLPKPPPFPTWVPSADQADWERDMATETAALKEPTWKKLLLGTGSA